MGNLSLVGVTIIAAVALVLTCFWLHYKWGAAYAAEGDRQGAIADHPQAITLNPDYAEAYYNRGVARAALGDRQGAIADHTQAITLKPNFAMAYTNRGLERAALGDQQAALTDYTQ